MESGSAGMPGIAEDVLIMASERKTFDIMDQLLSDCGEEAVPASAELASLIEKYASSFTQPPPESSPKQPRKKRKRRRSPLQKKSTHYLAHKTAASLDEAQDEIRDLISPELKRLVSKSRIVDLALQHVLHELTERGMESPLVQALLETKNKT